VIANPANLEHARFLGAYKLVQIAFQSHRTSPELQECARAAVRLLARAATERHGSKAGLHRWEPQTPLTGEERLAFRRRKEAIEEEASAAEEARLGATQALEGGSERSTPRSTTSRSSLKRSPVPSLGLKSPAMYRHP